MITIFNLIGGFGGGSKYYNIPNAPFTSGYNRAQTGLGIAGQLRPTDVGSPAGDLDIVFTSNFTDGLSIRDFGSNKFRITNSDLWTVGGAGVKGLASLLINNDIELYGATSTSPLIIEAGLAGNSGINWISTVAGPTLKIQNVIAKSADFAGLLASSSTDKEGEGIYIGNTGTTFAATDSVYIEDVFITDKGRDGLQLGHITDIYVNRFTCYDVGKTNTSQQDHLVQIVDSNGLIENSIFDLAPRLCNLSTHGITFRNCLFVFNDASEIGFIGRTDNLVYYPTARHNGQPILFDSCYFLDLSGNSTGALINVQERIANVEFLNCVFDTPKSTLFQDTRVAGFTNSLVGTLTTNGNTTVSTLEQPTYMSTTLTDYDTHGLITSPFWLNLHMGNRTR